MLGAKLNQEKFLINMMEEKLSITSWKLKKILEKTIWKFWEKDLKQTNGNNLFNSCNQMMTPSGKRLQAYKKEEIENQ